MNLNSKEIYKNNQRLFPSLIEAFLHIPLYTCSSLVGLLRTTAHPFKWSKQQKLNINCPSSPLCFQQIFSSVLAFVFCGLALFHYCCSHACASAEAALAREFHISYSNTMEQCNSVCRANSVASSISSVKTAKSSVSGKSSVAG